MKIYRNSKKGQNDTNKKAMNQKGMGWSCQVPGTPRILPIKARLIFNLRVHESGCIRQKHRYLRDSRGFIFVGLVLLLLLLRGLLFLRFFFLVFLFLNTSIGIDTGIRQSESEHPPRTISDHGETRTNVGDQARKQLV